MIKEESKLGIAIDLIEFKLGEHMSKIRNNKDSKLNQELSEKYYELINIREKIYAGDKEQINKIINDFIGEEND